MTKTVTFYNDGVLDMRGLTTFGLSVKETESPIGYFGTGLKYAVAVCTRERQAVTILTGGRAYRFEVRDEEFRGRGFRPLFMVRDDGEETRLPFTLDLGWHWKLWQAYRELYCNALDEGGQAREELPAADDRTAVVVVGDEFAKVHRNRHRFINQDAALWEDDRLRVVPTSGVYLKGIRIADNLYRPTCFGYDFKSGVSLTEDRTLKDDFTAEHIIKAHLAQCSDYALVSRVLTAPENTFENQISWHVGVTSVSDEFRRALRDAVVADPKKVASGAVQLARSLFKNADVVETPHEATAAQRRALDRAVEFLAHRGVRVADYPLKIVRTLGDNVWGKAASGAIYLSAQAFDYGTKCLVATLYEEHLHLSKGYDDCTRNMQNHLFHTIVGLWEEIEGETL